MQETTGALKKTPLHDLFLEMGARLVDFSGWELPVQFSSVLEEHRAVREAAGLFDVSHMGEIEVRGPGALVLVQRLTCNDAARLGPGRAQYSVLTTESGAFVDDILVYRRGANDFLLVVNAANTGKDLAWVERHASEEARVTDASARFAQLAIQGPRSEAILQECTRIPLRGMKSYQFAEGEVRGAQAIVSRTGYTGEDGFEIYLPPAAAAGVYRALIEAGRGAGLRPCGLGARDTLRLEAAMPLYGNDVDDTTTVIEAGLSRLIHFDKGEFVGREALRRQQAEGPAMILAGFELQDRGIARHGHAVRAEGRQVGRVTSGTHSPTLKKSLGLAYLPPRLAAAGSRITIAIREREVAATVVPTPFIKRRRRGGLLEQG